MFYRFAADALVVFHLLFILFVLLGALLVLRWRWLALLHLPAATWGVVVEWFSLYCPLTPWEVALRRAAGEAGYTGGFVEHYLVTLIYPTGLTPQVQLWLGALVLTPNLALYLWIALRWRHDRRR